MKRNRIIIASLIAGMIIIASNQALAEEKSEDKIEVKIEDVIENNTKPTEFSQEKKLNMDDIVSLFEDEKDDESECTEDCDCSSENDDVDDTSEEEIEETVCADDELLEDETDESLEDLEKDDDNELEFSQQSITKNIDGCSISITGNFPDNTKIELTSNKDKGNIINRVEGTLDKNKGYFELASFDIKLYYQDGDETKSFKPADFDEDCRITISDCADGKDVSVYSLDNNCKQIPLDDNSFTMKNYCCYTVGIIYDSKSSICGKAPDGCSSCNVVARGKDVVYSTSANEYGWYLITDVDYSKAYFGSCFLIETE